MAHNPKKQRKHKKHLTLMFKKIFKIGFAKEPTREQILFGQLEDLETRLLLSKAFPDRTFL